MGQKEIGRRKMSRVDSTVQLLFSAQERNTSGYSFPASITSLHAREFQIFLDENSPAHCLFCAQEKRKIKASYSTFSVLSKMLKLIMIMGPVS